MSYNNFGLCCHFLESSTPGYQSTGYKNILIQKVLQLGRYKDRKYSIQQISSLYENNVDTLIKHLPKIFETYKVFRMPSGFFPLFDYIDEYLWNNDKIREKLFCLGTIVKSNNVRVTFHPGQFCSLTSENIQVRRNSAREINHHSWIMNMMQLDATPYYAINIHGGKRDREDCLVMELDNLLSPNARARVTLENDESCYSVGDLLKVYKRTSVPVVFDSHHHTFNDNGLTHQEAYDACVQTWRGIKPKQHISNTTLGLENSSFTKRRQHSHYIHQIPECQLNGTRNNQIDLMCEAKLKNIAIEKMKKDFEL
jgi:UV DNA damage endonuclease